jgi:hypothetical protein
MKKKVLEEEAAKIGTYFVRMYSNFVHRNGDGGERGIGKQRRKI